MDIMFPDIAALGLSFFGGAIMGWAMSRLLPGMKSNAYQPREWLPIAVYLTALGWFTYFVPQFILNTAGVEFAQQFVYGGIVFTVYMVALVITLWSFQKKREG